MPFNFGAFAGGLAQGLHQGQQLAIQRQEAQLRSKMLDAQMKHLDFQNQQLTNTIAQQKQAHDMASQAAGAYEASVTNGTPAVPAHEDPAQAMSVADVPAQAGPTPMTPQQQFIKSGLQQGKFTAGMAHLLGPGQGQAQHIPADALVPDNQGGWKPAMPGGKPITPYQQAEVDRQNRGLDIQSENAQATRDATAAQRDFNNRMAQQSTSDRQIRIWQGQDRINLMDQQHRAALYQQALKAKAATDPGPLRRIAESLGWPAQSTRDEQSALVESLRPKAVAQPPGAPAQPPSGATKLKILSIKPLGQ